MTKNIPFTRDWLLLGLAVGIGGALAKTLANVALDKAGVPTVQHTTLTDNLVLGRRTSLPRMFAEKPHTVGEKAAGYLMDTLAGGAYGAALSYIYAKSPPGNEVAKGVLGGAILELMTLAAGRQLDVPGFRNLTPGRVFTLLGLSGFFGGLQGAIFGRYGARLTTQSHPVLVAQSRPAEFEARRLAPTGQVAGRHVRRVARQGGASR